MRDVLKGQLRELIGTVSGDLAQRPVHANPTPVERDERHPDRRFVDREPEPLLGLAQLIVGGLRLPPRDAVRESAAAPARRRSAAPPRCRA